MRRVRSISKCAVAALLLTAPSAGQGQDLEVLLDGVSKLAKPGIPGPLVVFGDQAFVVATARDGSERVPVVAAARVGPGRIVVFGHTGYLGRATLREHDTGRLVHNAIRWAGDSDGTPRVAYSDLRAGLSLDGITAERIDREAWAERLPECQVLATSSGAPMTAPQIAALERHLERGGGIVLAGLGWGWQQLNPTLELARDHPWHAVLHTAGLAFGDGTVESIDDITHPADADALAELHAGLAVSSLDEDASAARCAAVLRAARALPASQFPALDRFVAGREVKLIRADDPLVEPLDRLVATLHELRREREPSPHASDFPGAVPADAKRVHATRTIDLATPGWASTGLYAAPGEEVTIRVPATATDRGLGIRIGCHKDTLWHKPKWQRFPEITRQEPIRDEVTRAVNPFGGPVYVTVPRERAGTIEVEIAGAVEAPWFVRDRTDATAWRDAIRHAPAPWAELQADRVILSVPSSVVRSLDDPRDLLVFWDDVLAMYAELGARPLPARPERIVTDRQISAGYMHSGYPIMMGLDVRRTLVDIAAMKAARHGGVWGFWHELGHNHQRPEWTFRGTTEVTCNLFSLFVQERLSGIRPIESHRLVPQRQRVAEFLASGAPFEQWKKEPFLALFMYAQLQDAFGWEAYQRAFKAYREAPREELPRNDAEKRNQWLIRMSLATGRDLGPFFERWGIPVSEHARNAVRRLPVWLPE